jgi:hypothetical protein
VIAVCGRCWLAEVNLKYVRSVMPCCGMSIGQSMRQDRESASSAPGGNTHLRPAAVAFALGEAIELQVMSGFGQTGHRADKAE